MYRLRFKIQRRVGEQTIAGNLPFRVIGISSTWDEGVGIGIGVVRIDG